MKLRFIFVLIAILFLTSSCKKDDDKDGSGMPTIERTESATFTLNGESKTFDTISSQYTDNPEYLDLSASSGGNVIQFECAPIPAAGTYTSSQTMGFAVSIGESLWFCNEGCNIVVNEHNTTLRWFDVSISGQMEGFLQTGNATLNSARIKAFY